MNLSPKAVRFVIDALEFYQKQHDERLERQELGEEEASDLANDRQYLEVIKQEFQKYRDDLMWRREVFQTDA